MGNSKSETTADGLSGRLVFGTVAKVFPFGAILRLPDTIEHGYLAISQVSEETIEGPLTNVLKAGDRVEVVVKWFNEEHKTWETSHKAVVQRQRLESIGLKKGGGRITAKVVRAQETEAILDIERVRGHIYGGFNAWNAYNVLYEAGYIAPADSLEVVIEGWETRGATPRLRPYLGEPLKILRGTICDGKVIFIRKDVVVKTSLHNDLYARLVGGEVAWVKLKDVIAAEETFPLDSTIPLIVGKYSDALQMFEAKVDWNRTNIPAREPELGSAVEAKVTVVRPSFAICQIADRVAGVLYHSTIIKEKTGDTRQYLHPGDVVKVVVEQRSERGTVLRFLQLVESIVEPEPTDSSDLVDLRSVRRAGGASGFQRDQQFRRNVLEAFDHTCCVCGVRHVFGSASAMEAAHIIPRANRGADTTRNSLCFCSLHHWAFDRGFLTIDENWRVAVARQITDLGAPASPLASHHGNELHVVDPTMISFDAIHWHRQNVFLDDYRLVRERVETDYGNVS